MTKSSKAELSEKEESTCNRLLEKSQEAFILAIELFNRPTIQYRVEGCAFFLCNAWELMLKARLIKTRGYSSIFYKKDPSRTLTLADCIKTVMTNKNDPVRLNIETVNRLRNTGTHFILKEYEITYGPIFQANIHNYDDKLFNYHGIEICDKIPDNYLILSVNRTDLNEDSLRAKYTPEVAERLLSTQSTIDRLTKKESNTKYAAYWHTEFRLSKKDGIPIKIDSSSSSTAKIVKHVDPMSRYPYRAKEVIGAVNNFLRKKHIDFIYNGQHNCRFNIYHFQLFCKYYRLKTDKRYSYDRATDVERGKGLHQHLYSSGIVEFIIEQIRLNPNVIETLKTHLNDRKENGSNE